MIKRSYFIIISAFCLGLAACSGGSKNTQENKAWLQSGQIVISKSAPEVSEPRSLNMLGFFPVAASHSGTWLSFNKTEKSISLMDGARVITTSKAQGGEDLTAGSYQVLHMQKNPLWYAPDSYFSTRSLDIPSQGDKARFRRGALGEYAVFINKETPIHSGPLWSSEIGGIRVSEDDLSKIYYQLQIGSIIEVK